LKKPIGSEIILAASVFVGIAAPPVSEFLRPFLFVFVFFLMLFSLLTIKVDEVLTDGLRSASLARIMGVQMIALPVVIGIWHRFLPGSGHWSELIFITACAGSIFGAPAFARVMGLDAGLALRGVIASTLLTPVVLPLLVPLFTRRTAEFDFLAYVARFCIFILVPLATAYWYQSRHQGPTDRGNRFFGAMTIVFLALFGIAIMDGIGERFRHVPWETFGMLGFALALHAMFFGVSALPFLRRDGHRALTAGLLSAYRNLAVVLAIGGAMLPPDFIVFAALWQIPMYVMPLIVRLWKSRSAA
jgi:BASS family bile acid:Na+ symporter